MEKIIHTMGQNNCGGRCIINVHLEDDKITKISTDTSQGDLMNPPLTACARGLNYHKTYLNEEKRLLYPMIRTGKRGSGEFRRASWEETIEKITCEWIRIRDTYGPESRYVNYAWGVESVFTPIDFAKRLLSLDGGYLGYYNSYSTACIAYTTPYMYGSLICGNSYADIVNTNLIILWGHNPAETRFDTLMYYLREAKKRNIPIICVDPRYHDTARALGAEWIPIKPASDAAMLDAMAYVMMEEMLYDEAFINKFCQGFTKESMPEGYENAENYFDYLKGDYDGIKKTPEWASNITGVPAEKIIELARRYASAKPGILMPGYGPQRNLNGEQTTRGCIALSCLTGNVGISGGWAGSGGWINLPPMPEMPRVPNPYKATIPVFSWTKAITDACSMTEADGVKGVGSLKSNIKMIVNLAGNTLINQHSNINATKALLEDESKVEFIVCSDVFMTPSAKYADVLLPGISALEMNNIVTPWNQGNFFGAVNKVAEPLGECKFEYDWLKEVARNLGIYDEFTEGHETLEDWVRDSYESLRKEVKELPTYEKFKEDGIYRYQNLPVEIGFKEQIEDFENHKFQTPSGKIEIFSTILYDMNLPETVPGIPKYISVSEGPDEDNEKYPLQLMGYHTKRRCHTIHDNNEEMEKLDPMAIHMNIADALARGISDGDEVRIFNDRGSVILPAKVSENIAVGVSAISQGAWYTSDENGNDIRGCINTLTMSKPTPLAHGNPQHTNRVEICKK